MGGRKVRSREPAPIRKGMRSGNQTTAKLKRHIRKRYSDKTKGHRFAISLAPAAVRDQPWEQQIDAVLGDDGIRVICAQSQYGVRDDKKL